MSKASAAAGSAKRGTKKGLSFDEKVALVERWMTTHPQPYTLKELQQRIPKQTAVVYQSVEECLKLLVAEGRIEEDRVGVSTLLWKFPPTEAQLANRSGRLSGRSGGREGISGSNAVLSGHPLSYTELLRRVTSDGAAAAQQQVSVSEIERWCASMPDAQLREWCDLLQAENHRAVASLSEERERLKLEGSDSCTHGDQDAPAGEAALLAELAHLQQLALQRAQLLAEHKKLSSRQALPELLDRLDRASLVALAAANRWTDNYYLAEEAVVKVGFGGNRRDVRAALQLPLELNYLSDDSDAEPNVDGCHQARLPCAGAHTGAEQSPLPPREGSRCRDAGGPSSAQEKHPLIRVAPSEDVFVARQADARSGEPTPGAAAAAAVATSAPHTDTTLQLSTSAKTNPSKTAKAPSAKRGTGKRTRS
ncbi:hypothetical protein LSCM1_05049 [Leishmania martiniquensis]|uniref:Mnd1 HTH domain-containing protein n=1 Tax=Leishmania martiniquensis TaxID=1580590 RepID=A0A836GMA1_9TRYP|nr:hypothetical protein LSCM1_05049 [Leishmania martiniquensis]